jgi:mono/diheme cytochrome c family protein
VASERVERRRADFARYKDDVKKEGKPFYPWAMFHDTVMSLVVVGIIFGLAVVWYYTSGEEPGDSGLLGPRYTEKADPGTTSFIPRPDWYFYFLFYLLRIFKWPESVILGTVGIPTILMILMFALPFVDIRAERRLLRRPVAVVASILVVISMAVLTYKGATAEESLGSAVEVDTWVERNDLAANAQELEGVENPEQTVREGAELFAASGCLTCHTYLGAGSQNLGAPDLTDRGSLEKGIDFQFEHLKCPSCVTPGSPMPPFAQLGDENLRKIAVFIEASKGEGS